MIRLSHVNKVYPVKKGNGVCALRDISLDFPDNGFVAVVGKSGCGKTTLLNAVGALDTIDKGSILVEFPDIHYSLDVASCNEGDLDEYRNLYLGCVFQDFFMIDEWTVKQNIEVVLEQQSYGDAQDNRNKGINQILEYVGLGGYEERYIKQLSGGEQQRVAIARALVKNPRIIIADEPTGNLDYENSECVLKLLSKISKRCLVIMVTHDVEAAETYAERILRIRDGCIISDEIKRKSIVGETEEGTSWERRVRPATLRFKTLMALAWQNLRIKRLKLLFSLLTLIILFSLLEVILAFQHVSIGKTISDMLNKNSDYFLYTYQKKNYSENWGLGDNLIVRNTVELRDKLTDVFGNDACYPMKTEIEISDKSEKNVTQGFLVIGGVKEPGYEFVGSMPNAPNEIALTDYLVDQLHLKNNGIGEHVIVEGQEYVVCGVSMIDWKKYNSFEERTYQEATYNAYVLEHSGCRMLVSERYKENLTDKQSISLYAANPVPMLIEASIQNKTDVAPVSMLETEGVFFVCGRYPKESYEIVVSFDFAVDNYMITSTNDIVEYDYLFPDIHGETKTDAFSGMVSLRDYIPYVEIVGIVDTNGMNGQVFVNDQVFETIKGQYMESCYYDAIEVYLSEQKRSEYCNFNELEKFGIKTENYQAEFVYNKFETLKTNKSLITFSIMIIGLLLFLLVILFFSFNVRDNHKKIGILRALGVTKKDIARMLMVEFSFMTGITLIFALLIECVYLAYYNWNIKKSFRIAFSMIHMNWFTILVPDVILVVGMCVAVLLPMYVMANSKPIELIKSV